MNFEPSPPCFPGRFCNSHTSKTRTLTQILTDAVLFNDSCELHAVQTIFGWSENEVKKHVAVELGHNSGWSYKAEQLAAQWLIQGRI